MGVSGGVDAKGSAADEEDTGARPLTSFVVPGGVELPIRSVDPDGVDPDLPEDSGAVLAGVRGGVDPGGVPDAVLPGVRAAVDPGGVGDGAGGR